MVLIPSCIAKVSKQSYYNCEVKVHVCIGVVLIKRKMVKPAKFKFITKLFKGVGHSKYYYAATCDHLFCKVLFRLYFVKKRSVNFLESRGRGGTPIQRIDYGLFI